MRWSKSIAGLATALVAIVAAQGPAQLPRQDRRIERRRDNNLVAWRGPEPGLARVAAGWSDRGQRLASQDALPFDSSNCRFVGNWPFGPSYAVAVDTARNLVFLGSGGGVYVLDVNDSNTVVKLSESLHTRQVVLGLAYQTNRLYVADSVDGLSIWDVTTPASPALLGSFDPAEDSVYSARDVAVAGNYAYVADAVESTLSVISFADPHAPVEVGRWRTPDLAMALAVAGNYAYVADYSAGLRVIDISNPQNPNEVGRCGVSGYSIDAVVAGNYAYVTTAESLFVIDVSNPLSPRKIGGFPAGHHTFQATAVAGHCAYTAYDDWSGGGGLVAIDVSDPANPQRVLDLQIGRDPEAVAATGNRAYLADFSTPGMVVFDIAIPESMSVVCEWWAPGPALSMAVAGNYAYVGAGGGSGNAGLYVIDVSNPQNPFEVGRVYQPQTPGETQGVAVAGNYAYLASTNNGLLVVDISNPANPTLVGACAPTGHPFIHVAAVGNRAYAIDVYGLMVIDASDPTNPQELGYCQLGYEVGEVAVVGNYAYVAGTDSGFTVVDVSDPLSPHSVAFNNQGTSGDGPVALVGNYAYTLGRTSGLLCAIDITNPLNPVTAGSVPYSTDGPFSLAVAGGCAYVTSFAWWLPTLAVFDVSNPQNMTEVGDYHDRWFGVAQQHGVAAVGNLAYLAEGSAGLEVIQFLGIGIEESNPLTVDRLPLNPSIIRGVLRLPAASGFKPQTASWLFDINGRQVMALRPGANDVGRLSPGVYFVRQAQAETQAQATRKVVLTE
jgi:hypothetical protein